jgi:5-methyltetrahydrofolate--homocysteine methyltransferase
MKILDGAMGTVLQNKGLDFSHIPEEYNITNSDIIIDIHREYIQAGSDFVYTNTFGANRYKLKETGFSVKEIVQSAVNNAKKATENSNAKVILDIGPIGQMLEPMGTLKFEEAYDTFKEIVQASENADVIVFETFTDLYELRAAVLAAKDCCDKPIFTTMSFEIDGRTFSGTSVETFAFTMESLGVNAIGINCSLGPKQITPFIQKMGEIVSLPLIVKPNAGLPDKDGNFNLNATDFALEIEELLAVCNNVKYIGGCCGTTPEFIKAVSRFKDIEKELVINKSKNCCSGTKTVYLDKPQILGERINPTGKKLFKEALINKDYDYILTQAIEQVDAGATMLDVNVGIPAIDEKEVMAELIKKIQAVTDVPLMIDSKSPEVIEAALRVYNGKGTVNSTTCEQVELEKILPVIKKYGANIVVLTIDENGIPQSKEQRMDMALRTAEQIQQMGIKKENIIFDCLTLSVSTESSQVKHTLNAVKELTDLGYMTVLGISNISFGLPDREKINANFLALALYNGLTLPIMNPLSTAMVDTFRATSVLTCNDINAEVFISTRVEVKAETTIIPQNTIDYYISKGLKTEVANAVKSLLETVSPFDIINNELIPALDKVGENFEKGKIFLPQLIMSAESAQTGFNEITEYYAKKGVTQEKKGCIVLATVKGDVHDIGKNIVKTLLSSYGFGVIDLGRDVPPETVLQAVIDNKAGLVGLSALMTTTLPAMEETIKLLKQLDCKIMVGGAVLTEDYALSIGADYYSKDAKSGVEIAKFLF